jgi:hypothetical protein
LEKIIGEFHAQTIATYPYSIGKSLELIIKPGRLFVRMRRTLLLSVRYSAFAKKLSNKKLLIFQRLFTFFLFILPYVAASHIINIRSEDALYSLTTGLVELGEYVKKSA